MWDVGCERKRLVRIVVYGPERRVGALEGQRVIDLARTYEMAEAARGRSGRTLPAGLLAFIEGGDSHVEAAGETLQYARDRDLPEQAAVPVASTTLHAPWPGRRIACVGGNYADHMLGMMPPRADGTRMTEEEVREQERKSPSWGFWKVPAEAVGPEGEIPYPSRTRYLDFEGEAAIVIGRRVKNFGAADYRPYVFGVTLLHDGSIRDGGGPVRGLSYNLAKNFDGSTALGPSIAVGELDPEDVDVTTDVNGERRQAYNTRDMIFKWGEVLAYLSQDFTLVPGDILSGGTAKGTAADMTPRAPDGSRSTDLFLKKGDEVVVSSAHIGALRLHIT